jgi:translation initiation factor IF-3
MIDSKEVRVIGSDGNQLGVMPPARALDIAREEDLDLVEISPTATPPVVKVMDFGKFKYSASKKEKHQRKKSATSQVKGIRLSPSTDEHDLMTKVRRAREFLMEGAKVKVSIWFRGRMIAHQEFGTRMLERMATELADIAKLENPPGMEGNRQMTMMLVKKS